MKFSKNVKILFAGSSIVLLTACASVPDDGGVRYVDVVFQEKFEGTAEMPRPGSPMPMSLSDIDQLIKEPISLELAERISIEANPTVKSKLAQVGIAEADYAQAGRLENPGLSYERFSGEEIGLAFGRFASHSGPASEDDDSDEVDDYDREVDEADLHAGAELAGG